MREDDTVSSASPKQDPPSRPAQAGADPKKKGEGPTRSRLNVRAAVVVAVVVLVLVPGYFALRAYQDRNQQSALLVQAREFLDKGRPGMSSTFLVRLRVGEILMDAKGVARLYPSRARGRDVVLLVGAVLAVLGLMLAVSPALRLYLDQTLDGLVEWVRSIG